MAICVERSLALVVGLLAILKAGGAYLPLDPDYPAERLRFMLRDSGARLLLTTAAPAAGPAWAGGDAGEPAVETLCVDEPAVAGPAPREAGRRLPGRARALPDHLAYVIYTSGSTGRPKGTMNTHRGIVNRLLWMQDQYRLQADDRVLQKTPVSFDVSVWELFWPLATGARLVMARPAGHRDVAYLRRVLVEQAITTLHFVPSMLRAFLDDWRSQEADAGGVPRGGSLRRVMASGEALDDDLQAAFHAALDAPLHNLYGPTEAAVDVTFWACVRQDDPRRVVPIGRPVANTAIALLDRAGREVPIGVAGELYISGVQLARGYLRRPALTAERFVPAAVAAGGGEADGDRAYRTGDVARWLPDGAIDFLGRADAQVKIRGVRIEPAEIAAAIARHPAVRQAVVVTAPHPAAGDHRLVAYLVPDPVCAAPLAVRAPVAAVAEPVASDLYELPNGLTVASLNRGETDFLYQEIFAGQGYLRHGIRLAEGDCVFDVGANIGMFTLFVGQRLRDVTIFAFEPIPPVYQTLRVNAERYGLRARLFECALADAPGTAELTYYPHATLISGRHADADAERRVVRGFLRGRPGGSDEPNLVEELLDERLRSERVAARLRTLSEVIAEHAVERIDLLKVDVEKAELEVLRGLRDQDWAKVRQVVVEVHDVAGRLQEIVALLGRHGFQVAVEQDTALAETVLYNLYARRPDAGPDAAAAVPVPPSGAAGRVWSSRRELFAELREQLAAALPDVMVPSAFVVVPALPLTPSGKVDRRALPAPDWDDVQGVGGMANGGAMGRVAPGDARQELLAGMFAELLGLAPERFGIHDSFFALGGHSLLATQLVSRVRRAFGVELPVRIVFQHPTVAGLGGAIAGLDAPAAAPPLGPRHGPGPAPLSFAQQRIWFLDRLAGGADHSYNIPAGLRLEGYLDAAAMARTLGAIARRHQVLRTVFVETAAGPLQVVRPAPAAALPIPLVDLAALAAPAAREGEAARLLAAEARRHFDLASEPPLRASLLRLTAREHHLLVTQHHVASDGWSLGILVGELAAIYGSLVAGKRDAVVSAARLPALPIQYADFAVWQRDWLAGPVLERELAWWRRRLAGAPAQLDLPADRPRPAVKSGRGAACPVELSPSVGAALAGAGRRQSATLAMGLLAGFAALLGRHGNQRDLSLGMPVAGRNRLEIEGLIGCFVNTLVLRVDLAAAATFGGLMAQVRESLLDAQLHQDLPFEKLVEELEPGRSLAAAPLFQALLTVQNAPLPPLVLPGLTATPLASPAVTAAKFDLSLNLGETAAGGVSGLLTYSTDLFDGATAVRLAAHLAALLAAAAAAPAAPLGELPLLSAAERHQLLAEWNDTPTAQPAMAAGCLHELAASWAAAEPDAVAVVCEREALSRGELDRRAGRLARRLRAVGVGPEEVVAIRLDLGLDAIVAVLATLKSGGAYLALDADLPAQRCAAILADARPRALLCRGAAPAGCAVPVIDPAAVDPGPAAGSDGDGDGDAAGARLPAVDPANLAYVIYTSGSTGTPKRVGIEHRQVTAYLPAVLARLGLPRQALLSLHQTLAVDAPATQLFAALCYGAALQLVVRERALDPERAADYFAAQPVDFLKIAPSHLGALLLGTRPRDILPRRLTMVGGEAIFWPLAEQIAALAGGGRLLNHYGPTEATVGVLTHWVEVPEGARPGVGSVPIGRPLASVRAYVLDAQLLPVAAGLAGELFIGGPQVTRGYLGRGDLTAERFRPDPWAPEPGGRMYGTGDQVRAGRDGVVTFLGRTDFQVKIRGFRIELGEIEAALQALPEVAAAAVVARGAAGGEPRLAAYVVPRPGTAPTALALRQALAGRLPAPMVPRDVVLLADLPRTGHGKLDRKALPEPAAEPATDFAAAAGGRLGATVATVGIGVALGDAVELALADAWSLLLGQAPASREQSFFDAGGHSLLAMQLAAHLRRSLGVELPLRALFEAPAFGAVAERLRQVAAAGTGAQLPPLAPVAGRGTELPLSFAQQRLWFLDQLQPGSAVYNMPYAIELTGDLKPAVLARCFAELRRRHETLRTVFAAAPDGPRQVVLPAPPSDGGALPVVDLAALPADLRERAAAALLAAEAGRCFDLARGTRAPASAGWPSWPAGLLRVTLLRRGPRDHLLLATLHHIVSDGWSRGVLVGEIAALYGAFAAGAPSPLPELALQYGDYTLWQRVWLSGATFERELVWWRERLRGVPPVVDLPLDRARPAVAGARGSSRLLALPAGWSEWLGQLARERGVTPFMVLFAGLAGLLGRHGAQQRFAIGSPIAGRRHVELEPLIGFFVNTLVLPADLSGRPTFAELLDRARDTCLGAYSHQDLPFEKLVEELAPERSLAHSPLFQVLLVLQNTPRQAIDLPGLTLRSREAETTVAKFDLTFAFDQAGEQLTGAAQWNADLFDAATITRLAGHLTAFVAAGAAAPDRWFAELPLLGAAERQQVEEWNATASAPRASVGLAGLVAAQAARTPEAVAAVFGDQALTYGELDRRAAALAAALAARGVGPDVAVALCIAPSLDMAVAVLAVLAAGGAYLPLDPAYPRERLAAMLEDGRPAVLLAAPDLLERLPAQRPPELPWQDIVRSPAAAAAAAGGHGPARALATAAGLGYVIFTSGSTGRPKAIGLPQGALVNLIQWHLDTLLCGARTLQFASLSFDASCHEMFACWSSGGTLVLIPETLRRDARELARLCVVETIEKAILPVLVLQQLAEIYAEPGAPLPVWKEMTTTGEQMQITPAVVELFERLPGCRLHNHYGPSESHVVTTHTLGREPREWAFHPPIGKPLANSRIELLGPGLDRVPQGAPGELYIGGVCLARGYLGRPDLTAERFVPDPWSCLPGERLYKTGDLSRYRPGGDIEYLGRLDHQVKIRGFRVEPAEVESALGAHPALVETVVVAMDAPEGGKRLVAYLVGPPGGDRPAAAALRAWLGERLPHYMLPAAFVWLDTMPLSPNGKVDRQALPRPEAAGRAQEGPPAAAPRDLVELRLAGVWQDLLGAGPIGPADSFFGLGGHSLLAVRLMNRIEAAFGQRLPLAALFESPTLEALAVRLRRGAPPARREPLVHLHGDGQNLPLFLVHPAGGNVLCYWQLARALGDDTPVYGLQLPDAVDAAAPAPTVEALAARYLETIRTVQPEGPCHLAGWSLGGAIAFEMARQLDLAGRQVGLLALLDSFAPSAATPPPAGADLVRRFGADLAGLLGQGRPSQAPFDLPDTEAEALAALDAYGRAQGLLPPDLDRGSIAQLFALFRTSTAALAAYRPRPYGGEALLFAAADSSAASPDRGWQPLIRQLTVQPIAGDHYALVRHPAADAIAAALRPLLAAVRQPVPQ